MLNSPYAHSIADAAALRLNSDMLFATLRVPVPRKPAGCTRSDRSSSETLLDPLGAFAYHMGKGVVHEHLSRPHFRPLPLPTSCGHCWELPWGRSSNGLLPLQLLFRAPHAPLPQSRTSINKQQATRASRRVASCVPSQPRDHLKPWQSSRVSPNAMLYCGACFATTAPLFRFHSLSPDTDRRLSPSTASVCSIVAVNQFHH
jgi:hypothetical protein